MSTSSLYNVDQVAKRLGKSVRFVWGVISKRELGCYRVGRSVRVSEADIDAYLARGRQEARP
ncbi:MAG: helix-turn-helix domain-containing protein [Candidatus Eremiobacteraeota bacterium]|nr:helix-turn-helix domain-containing protein [Candidatus Eremiobacteraeota bacterium]